MPFTCSICSLDIQVGEPMLSDEKMCLAHKSCVDRLIKEPAHPSINIPSVNLSPVEVHTKVSGPGFGNPTASIEPCLMPSTKFCSECGKAAISMCPSCLAYVHHGYGGHEGSCSLVHESKCSGARRSREIDPKPPTPIVITAPRNGVHSAAPKKKGRSRR